MKRIMIRDIHLGKTGIKTYHVQGQNHFTEQVTLRVNLLDFLSGL